MDDAIARDGALARCNQDKEAALTDIECSNARRAAAAVAVAEERARSGELEQESERKLAARREREAAEQQAELRAVAEAAAAAERAYEAQWRDPNTSAVRADAYEVYAEHEGGQRPRIPSLELAAVTPPPSDLEFAEPDLALDEAVIPRPFRNSTDGSETLAR